MADPSKRLLLLHGAGLGGWIWDRVTPHLTVPAEAVDLPGRTDGTNPGTVTLKQCIDFVAGKVQPGTILVGHSFSGEVALGVAATHPDDVAAVILVGGVVPEDGKSFMSLLPLPQRALLYVLLKLAPNGIKIPASQIKKGYCGDLDDATTDLVLARSVREAPRIYLDPLEWAALPADLPRFYVKLLNDESINPEMQDQMIDRIRATSVESLRTGHLPMLAQPSEMAATLNRLSVIV